MPVYLIDASIYIFQAHFSPYIECYDKNGEDLSALYGFSQFLLQFLRREAPATVAVAMDESLFCGFRHELCANYKSNRELPDENLARQLAACAELADILGLACFGSRRYEADDIIGTLSRRLRDAGYLDREPLAVVSRDKDLAQLLKSRRDYLWDYQKNRKRTRLDIVDEFGVSPEQIPDYLGLVGDAVDRITGVPGLGPVKGRVLLGEFADLDGIYDNLERVGMLTLRGATRLPALLQTHRDLAYLSRRLATIVEDVNEDTEAFATVGLDVLTRRPADISRLIRFLDEQHFHERFHLNMGDAFAALNEKSF